MRVGTTFRPASLVGVMVNQGVHPQRRGDFWSQQISVDFVDITGKRMQEVIADLNLKLGDPQSLDGVLCTLDSLPALRAGAKVRAILVTGSSDRSDDVLLRDDIHVIGDLKGKKILVPDGFDHRVLDDALQGWDCHQDLRLVPSAHILRDLSQRDDIAAALLFGPDVVAVHRDHYAWRMLHDLHPASQKTYDVLAVRKDLIDQHNAVVTKFVSTWLDRESPYVSKVMEAVSDLDQYKRIGEDAIGVLSQVGWSTIDGNQKLFSGELEMRWNQSVGYWHNHGINSFNYSEAVDGQFIRKLYDKRQPRSVPDTKDFVCIPNDSDSDPDPQVVFEPHEDRPTRIRQDAFEKNLGQFLAKHARAQYYCVVPELKGKDEALFKRRIEYVKDRLKVRTDDLSKVRDEVRGSGDDSGIGPFTIRVEVGSAPEAK